MVYIRVSASNMQNLWCILKTMSKRVISILKSKEKIISKFVFEKCSDDRSHKMENKNTLVCFGLSISWLSWLVKTLPDRFNLISPNIDHRKLH